RSRGGVSHAVANRAYRNLYSPLTRGCFRLLRWSGQSGDVFPAHAGVFSLFTFSEQKTARLPLGKAG
ncbi:MAG: hypothetical protein VB056_01100, partial [Sphaerochaeta associata]|uniref:hypothetical protein n=1 Tax=Sphaerochaeta associata TaxID=1129264 RepID=UPI002B21852A